MTFMTWTLRGQQGKFNTPSAKKLNVGAKAQDDEVHMLLDTSHDICPDEVTDQQDKLITPRVKSLIGRAKMRRDEKVTSETLDETVV
jgi:hypothetical protein